MRTPTLEWQTNGMCNYDCSYCIQSRAYRRGHPTDEEIDAFLSFFATLPQTWEIKMSGGKPFAFKGFMERVIPGLSKLPHTISILTNLSASPETLKQFVNLVGDKLNVVSASLHLEYVTVEDFTLKADALRRWLPAHASLVVNNVLVPGTLDSLFAVRRAVEASGLRYFPQVMKTKQGVFEYSQSEQSQVVALTGKNPTARQANIAPSYYGEKCWSGVEYFVLDQRGDAYACRTAKRHGEGYLGNVLNGTFQLNRHPTFCPYKICPCTVPANRGIIEGVASGTSASTQKVGA